jgi:hypothetical protein
VLRVVSDAAPGDSAENGDMLEMHLIPFVPPILQRLDADQQASCVPPPCARSNKSLLLTGSGHKDIRMLPNPCVLKRVCKVQVVYIAPPPGLLDIGRRRMLLSYLRPILQVLKVLRRVCTTAHCQ